MKPIKFPGATHSLGTPQGWNEEKQGRCGDLPIMVENNTCISCWTLTEMERQAVMGGKNIYVHVVNGETQPPIMLKVEG